MTASLKHPAGRALPDAPRRAPTPLTVCTPGRDAGRSSGTDIGESRPGVRPPWMDLGLCAEVDPDLHFPEKGASTRQAKEICRRCFVRADCRDFAIATNEQHGVWGGMSRAERNAYRDANLGTVA